MLSKVLKGSGLHVRSFGHMMKADRHWMRYIPYSPKPRPSSQLPWNLSKSTASSAEPHRTIPVVTVFSDFPENGSVVLSDALEYIVTEVGGGRSVKSPWSNLSHLHETTVKHHVNRMNIERYIPDECNTGDAGL